MKLLSVVGVAVLVGCAAKELPISKLPPVDAASSGEVVVVRPSAFIADDFSFYLNVNQENILALRSRMHVRFRLPEGEHRIAIRCVGLFSEDIKESATTQRIVASQTLYLAVEPKGGCATIEAVSEPEGRKLVSNTSRQPL